MTAGRDRCPIRWLGGATLLSMAMVAAGCAGHAASPHPHTLAFEITGQAELSSLTYVINGQKTTETSVRLPWRKTLHLPTREGGHTWSLKTQNKGSGSAFVVVYVDGRSITSGGCAGDGCSSDESGSIRD